MTIDPYPDLPQLPRAVQLACQTIQRVVEEALSNSGDVTPSD
ncbi:MULTISPECIES: hypothetical protein [unclassified Mycobacterium]|nr:MULTISPECIES: hypothetical protein [unclassified Mycobacterium]